MSTRYLVETQAERAGRVRKTRISADGQILGYNDVIHLWREDQAFRQSYIDHLAATPFRAYRWETPPVRAGSLDRHYEHVCVDSPFLDRPPNPRPFSSYFTSAQVAVFENLGGDGLMVAPCPHAPDETYVQIGSFMRDAPDEQRHALWIAVAEQMAQRVGADPVWLNTAGGGVAWLHVRLDSTPKYYSYRPYARQDA